MSSEIDKIDIIHCTVIHTIVIFVVSSNLRLIFLTVCLNALLLSLTCLVFSPSYTLIFILRSLSSPSVSPCLASMHMSWLTVLGGMWLNAQFLNSILA